MESIDVTAVFFNALVILLSISAVAGGFWYLIAHRLNKDEDTTFNSTK